MSIFKTHVIRKIIPLISITGSCGGLTVAAMQIAGTEKSFIGTGIIFILYILAGTAVGLFASIYFTGKGIEFIARDGKGKILFVRQKIYLLTSVAMVAAYITNVKTGVGAGVVAAIFFGGAFLLGITNGIYDYRESVAKNTLYLGALPVMLSFTYGYYINGSYEAIDMAWLFGSVYLFSYLLFTNRMQLNTVIFFRKSINVENSRKIRTFNDRLIVLLYMLYLVMFNFRKLLNISYDFFLSVINWCLVVMAAIMNWLLVDIKTDGAAELQEKEELDYLEKIERPWLAMLIKIAIYIIFIAMGIAIVVSLIVLVRKIIKKIKEVIRNNYNKSMSVKKVKTKEYEEKSEIVKENNGKRLIKLKRKKFKYNMKNLNKIPLAEDKVRYVYGFVLERLHHKHVDIEDSDTPEEILARIRKHRNGEKLNKVGFEEFTEKYRRVRYGRKKAEVNEDFAKKGEKFEKAVSDIYVEPKK